MFIYSAIHNNILMKISTASLIIDVRVGYTVNNQPQDQLKWKYFDKIENKNNKRSTIQK